MRSLRLSFLFGWLATTGVAMATVCDCRPEFATEAEASGICSKIKDDSKWCKIKFGSGATQLGGERHVEFSQVLLTNGFKVDVPRAITEVQKLPEDWTSETVSTHVSAMFAVALWDTAPQRLKEALSVFQDAAGPVLEATRTNTPSFRVGKYTVDVARGCIQLSDGTFSAMLRTRFALPLDERSRKDGRCAR